METTVNNYRRLPGRGTSFAHYYSLYQGPDCLLQVASTGWSERYKRFYYEDITAFVVRRTNTGAIVNLVLAVLALFCIGLALFDVARPAMFILSATCILPLVYSLLAGPTCLCHVYTSVQVERIPSLRRLRVAHKTLARIRPLIEQTQAAIPSSAAAASAPASPDAGLPSSSPPAP